MNKLAIFFSLVFFAIVCFISCKHDIPEGSVTPPPIVNPPSNPGGGGGTGGGTGSNLVCFETDVLPIFQTNCAKSGCHDAASHQKGYVFDNYANIVRDGIEPGNAGDSEVYEVLFETGNDKMPRPPNPDLSPAQKALIGRWINEGAQNTRNCNTGSCDPSLFKFNADIKPILATNCTGCHSGGAPSAGINLTSYDVVKQVAQNGRLVGAITHAAGYSPMPKNANKLSDCKINQIKNWVAAGAPNN
jgi:mono/diheme cytochrome c family protein